MVKETMTERESKDTSIKKRRKTNSSSSTIPKIPQGDVYKNVIEYEETEAELRDPEEDMALFNKTCDEIRTLMKGITALKQNMTDQVHSEMAKKRTQASLLFVVLKKLNRLEKFRTKKSRDTLNKVKQQVDSYHLQLQNLLYEILHLKKEVTKCLEFKSKDEEIDLVPVEEFFLHAPENISRPEITAEDPHQLKLARLEWELQQRKQLSVLCHKLLETKEKVAKEIQMKRARLDNLTPRLKNILEETKPLQDYLGLPLDKIRKQHQIAYLLPKPLYILYVQSDAYKDACDKHMTVVVNGDEEEARVNPTITEASEAEDSDSDQETEAPEDGGNRQKHHHRKVSRSERLEEKKKQLLQKHPLWVEMCIKLPDGNGISISFYYLINLHIVTVKCRVNLLQQVYGISAGDLISPANILSGLFSQDFGEDSPNIANHYQLKHIGLNKYKTYIPELGIPYMWAQRMGGLDFMSVRVDEVSQSSQSSSSHEGIRPSVDVSQASLGFTIRAIRQRLRARLALCVQLQAFETGNVMVPPTLRSKFPARVYSQLVSWAPAVWEDYKVAPITQQVVQDEAVSQVDSFYRAVLIRGTAKLIALIAVKPDYPISPTVFCLNLLWNGEHNRNNDDAVRDMEKEVNIHWKELIHGEGWGRGLLAAQIQRLLSCLDVYLEVAGCIGVAPPEFPRDKIFIKPVRGRNRSRPYKYLQVGGGIFTQR